MLTNSVPSALGLAIVACLCSFLAGCDASGDGRVTDRSAAWAVPSDDDVSALLAQRMERNGVGMVVGIVSGNRRSVLAHGRTGAPDDRPLNGETVFQIGSLTKVITSLLLADMAVSGEVDLDEPLSAFLPRSISLAEKGRPITLRDLSTHTSGLPSMPDNFDIRGQPDPYEAYTVEQLWAFLSEYEPAAEPGTQYAYSNLGVSLLGRALGMRTGRSYEDLVRNRILLPLGMTSTSIKLNPSQSSRLAPGHDPYLQPIKTWEMATLQASGSLRSTVNDMLKLLELYLGKSGPPRLRAAARLQLGEGVELDGSFRALGLGLRPDGTFRHSGGKAGYRSGLAFNPQSGIGAVVLANARTYDSEPMALALHLATGFPLPAAKPAPEDKQRAALQQIELDRFPGRYKSADGRAWEVASAGAFLRIRYPGNAILEFAASGERDFFYNAGNDDITFEIDAEGHVTGMTLFGDGKARGVGEFMARQDQ